eukprot:TRINITY_DN61007_c0_g1_i1.p1 TRINITY_DN61007_c0_g1~~TRINITY_DN61007_c0_g1_i1.p1  ORF type:complete len:517 (+),score=82.80 TRINITY_DN61007_c0_g1_i1:97-1647(+)
MAAAGALALSAASVAAGMEFAPVQGDWWLNATFQGCVAAAGCSVRVEFDATPAGAWAAWNASAGGVALTRRTAASAEQLVYRLPYGHEPGAPLRSVAVLRRGVYHFLWVNGVYTAFALHAAGDIFCHNGTIAAEEPAVAGSVVTVSGGGTLAWAARTLLRWEHPLPTAPALLTSTDRTSWYARQAIPGAHLYVDGWHYVWFCGADYADPSVEAGGKVRTGVMRSRTLSADAADWAVRDTPVLEGTTGAWDEDNVCVGGAVLTDDGRVALSYAGYRFAASHGGTGKDHDALGMAFAEVSALWESTYSKWSQPVLEKGPPGTWDGGAMHEHDMVRLPNGTYLLFYTGCCGDCPGGLCDQGGLALSENLTTWVKHPANPVLRWNRDRQRWDAKHRRPRGLNLINGTWYLLYEGAAFDNDPGSANCTRDSVGLARSSDLLTWETHPLQVSIPWQPGSGFDSEWTGWPRAYVAPATATTKAAVHVIYAAGGPDMLNTSRRWATSGVRSWDLDKFTSWSVLP